MDEKLDDLNVKINSSLQILENCDKARKTFYGDLISLQVFLEDVEKRKKVDEEEKAKEKEKERERQMELEREQAREDEEWL